MCTKVCVSIWLPWEKGEKSIAKKSISKWIFFQHVGVIKPNMEKGRSSRCLSIVDYIKLSKWCSWPDFSNPFLFHVTYCFPFAVLKFSFLIFHTLSPFFSYWTHLLYSSYFCLTAVKNPKWPTVLFSAFPLSSSHPFLEKYNSHLNSCAGCQQPLKVASNFSPAHSSEHNSTSSLGLFIYMTECICQSSRDTLFAGDAISSPL